jgi:hypothetical protein
VTTSEQIGEIVAALVKAQSVMRNATMNKVNPHFKSKYADLAGIRDAVTTALTANGLAVIQTLDRFSADGHVGTYVITRLFHTSGQWIESRCQIPDCADMQKMGSAITYARRYSLSAICGIAADEDDDGHAAAASVKSSAKAKATPTRLPAAPPDKGGLIGVPLPPPPTTQSYDEWLVDIGAKADEGGDAWLRAISKSPIEYASQLRRDGATYKAIKTRASKIPVHA